MRLFVLIRNRDTQQTTQTFLILINSREGPSTSQCASVIQIVRPSESKADTQPQLQPALLRLSAMISQDFTTADSRLLFLAEFLETRDHCAKGPRLDRA